MVPVLQPLPLDWSGKSPSNRTKGEIHNIASQYDLPYRIIVMEKGYFYTEDLWIMDNRGYVLKEDQDYQCISLNKEIAKVTSKTACAVILITNPDVGNIIRIDAQMAGGRFCSLTPAILETAFNVVDSANRKVYWRNLTNKPNNYRPNGHLHALWELYGFTEPTNVLKRMSTALDKKTSNAFDGLFNEYLYQMSLIGQDLTAAEAQLTAHINDHNNPHQFSRKQAQLEYVYNASIATEVEARQASGTLLYTYATPLRARQAIESNFYPTLEFHLTDYNNPHQDTAAKLGTYTTLEFGLKLQNYYTRGETVNDTYRLVGRTYPEIVALTRNRIPIQNITVGVLNQMQYAASIAPPGTIAVPGPNGILMWRSVAEIVNKYAPKGAEVIYTRSIFGNTVNSAAEVYRVKAWIASLVGTNFPEDSIFIFVHEWWFVGKAGGYMNTIVHNLGMATLKNKQWVIPGWPGM